MSIQHIRKQGIIRKLEVNNFSCSSNNSIGQIFIMPLKAGFTGDSVSIFSANMSMPIDLRKVTKIQQNNKESSGIAVSLIKENDEGFIINYEAPIIYLDESYECKAGD